MKRKWIKVLVVLFVAVLAGQPVGAQKMAEKRDDNEQHVRGKIAQVTGDAIVVATNTGKVRLTLPKELTVLKLTKASFTDVAFGVYVGAVSKRLNAYSPIVRDSMSWLHHGYELRVFDEKLRGLALGHTTWDLTGDSVMTHGWVDDLEIRVISIKYGPTEEEETDVDVPRDAPIHMLSIGDRGLLREGANVFVGAQKGEVTFVMVGQDGIVPAL
jgi:hypothetical protein